MYGDVVLGVDHCHFEDMLETPRTTGLRLDTDLRRTTGSAGRDVSRNGRGGAGQAVPAGSDEQLWGAIGAVFGSWMNRAR